jgi:hypothetical protein
MQDTATAIRSPPADYGQRKVTHRIVSRSRGPATSNDRVIFVEQAAHTHPDRFSFLTIIEEQYPFQQDPRAFARNFLFMKRKRFQPEPSRESIGRASR